MQQLRNRSNLLRNNPSISITPKHPHTSRSIQSSSYITSNSHLPSAIGSSSSSVPLSTYQPKLPSSITLTKFDRSPAAHKSSEISTQADSANPCYGPRYSTEYPRSLDRLQTRNEYTTRVSQPSYTNNFPPQYHRPSSSQ